MPLKRAVGNMYSWVTHVHAHLAGACPHRCPYCYVQAIGKRFAVERFGGPVRLLEEELAVRYGKGRVIFVEHLNDLFAGAVPDAWIARILTHCRNFPQNTYVLQTKNPQRLWDYQTILPAFVALGTTIETNRATAGPAPQPRERAEALGEIARGGGVEKFVTIEPVQRFDVPELLELLTIARPDFVNLGADSKGHGLEEPSKSALWALIAGIEKLGIELRQKRNLDRLLH